MACNWNFTEHGMEKTCFPFGSLYEIDLGSFDGWLYAKWFGFNKHCCLSDCQQPNFDLYWWKRKLDIDSESPIFGRDSYIQEKTIIFQTKVFVIWVNKSWVSKVGNWKVHLSEFGQENQSYHKLSYQILGFCGSEKFTSSKGWGSEKITIFV